MSETFAVRAAMLGGVAARTFGWRPAEFWNATPAELAMTLGPAVQNAAPPDHALIQQLIERDRDGR